MPYYFQMYWHYTTTIACCNWTHKDLSQLVNGFHVSSFLQGPFLHMVPPLEEEIVHDQSEPRGQLQTFFTSISFPQQLFQLIPVHIFNISYFIRVWIVVNISDNEK